VITEGQQVIYRTNIATMSAPRRGDWEGATSGGSMGISGIGGGEGLTDPSAPVLLQPEAERLIENLRTFSLREVGSEKWIEQHEVIEKLNLQAHQSARANSEDFVLEALITYEKLSVLIHELIVIETWKDFIYPKIEKDLAKKHSMRAYFVLYHEATLSNLFEVLFFHDYAVEALEDEMIELVDWCVRRMIYLNALPPDHAKKWTRAAKKRPKPTGDEEKDQAAAVAAAKAAAAELNEKTPEDDLRRHFLEIQFRSCVSAATIVRYLTQHTEKLSLGVLTRMLDTHDLLMLLCPLIENPPWTWRSYESGQWLKFVDQKWTVVLPANLLKLTKLEGQIWLAVYNLLTDKACGEKYFFTSQRKDNLLRARKYINDVLLDQLPMLADIQRFMDEITIMRPPEASEKNMGSLIMEQVPAIRDGMVQRSNWVEEARFALVEVFGQANDRDDRGLAKLAELYAGDAMESLVAEQEITPEELRGPLVGGKVRVFAQGEENGKPCIVLDLKRAEGKPTPQSTSVGMFERYQLLTIGSAYGTPVPYGGSMKVTLTFQDTTTKTIETEVPLEMPAMTLPDFEAATDQPLDIDGKVCPTVSWLKLGSFEDKAIAQVQLKRANKTRKSSATEMADGSAKLHCYNVGTLFVSVPLVGQAAKNAVEKKLMKEFQEKNGVTSEKKGCPEEQDTTSTGAGVAAVKAPLVVDINAVDDTAKENEKQQQPQAPSVKAGLKHLTAQQSTVEVAEANGDDDNAIDIAITQVDELD
jgi:zinc finger MYND domain-containing protein 10